MLVVKMYFYLLSMVTVFQNSPSNNWMFSLFPGRAEKPVAVMSSK